MSKILSCLLLFSFSCAEQPRERSPEVEDQPAAAAVNDTLPAQPTDLSYLMGQFDPATHPDFVTIPAEYADRANRYLHKDTYAAYLRMYEAAKADGVDLKIISATRNFADQKGIWEAKWTGERILSDGVNAATDITDPKERALKILEYSSMPGSSRHHWGSDIDLNNLNNAYFEAGSGKKVYDWLQANAATYGFCQPYTAGRPHGYQEEKWHWSYLPIARPLTNLAKQQLANQMISGFAGAETASTIDVVQHYVLGINEDCL